MKARIKAAIDKLENRHDGIPMDERVVENRDYARLIMLIKTLKNFNSQLDRIEEMLDKLGV